MHYVHNKNIGLLIIRVVVGAIFAYAGWLKVSNMGGDTGTIASFAQMGFNAFWAYVASYTEFLGGIALILGYGTKIAGILLTITMAVAIKVVYPVGGLQMAMLPIVLGAVTLGLTFTGSGSYALGAKCGCPCKEGVCPVESTTPQA